MPNKYYYLVASLPYLSFDGKDFPEKKTFIAECRQWLDEKDMKALLEVDIKDPSPGDNDTDIVRQWKTFDTEVREVIAGRRAQKGKGAGKANAYFSAEDLEGKNPLEAEKVIEHARWTFIEGEEYKHPFSINWLILYYIKLQISERLAGFDKDKGKEIFKQLCEVKDEQKKW